MIVDGTNITFEKMSKKLFHDAIHKKGGSAEFTLPAGAYAVAFLSGNTGIKIPKGYPDRIPSAGAAKKHYYSYFLIHEKVYTMSEEGKKVPQYVVRGGLHANYQEKSVCFDQQPYERTFVISAILDLYGETPFVHPNCSKHIEGRYQNQELRCSFTSIYGTYPYEAKFHYHDEGEKDEKGNEKGMSNRCKQNRVMDFQFKTPPK